MEGMLGFEPNILGKMKNFDTILKGWLGEISCEEL